MLTAVPPFLSTLVCSFPHGYPNNPPVVRCIDPEFVAKHGARAKLDANGSPDPQWVRMLTPDEILVGWSRVHTISDVLHTLRHLFYRAGPLVTTIETNGSARVYDISSGGNGKPGAGAAGSATGGGNDGLQLPPHGRATSASRSGSASAGALRQSHSGPELPSAEAVSVNRDTDSRSKSSGRQRSGSRNRSGSAGPPGASSRAGSAGLPFPTPRGAPIPRSRLLGLASGHFGLQGRRMTMEDEVVVMDSITIPAAAAAGAAASTSAGADDEGGSAGAGARAQLPSSSQPQQSRHLPFGSSSHSGTSNSSSAGVDELQVGVFGVFDGHGGVTAATFSASTVHKYVAENLSRGNCNVSQALFEAFQRVDTEFEDAYLKKLKQLKQKDDMARHERMQRSGRPSRDRVVAPFSSATSSSTGMEDPDADEIDADMDGGSRDDGDDDAIDFSNLRLDGYGEELQSSGCTACVAVIAGRPGGGGTITVANVGDTRAILCRQGDAVAMTLDHKAGRPDEKGRVFANGGMIWKNRVLGKLAISRAIGDVTLKRNERNEGLLVSGEPEIYEAEMLPHDEFVVLACDGVFDVISSQKAVDIVRGALRGGSTPDEAAKELAQAAYEEGSEDNISVVVVKIVSPEAEASLMTATPAPAQPLRHSRYTDIAEGSSTEDAFDATAVDVEDVLGAVTSSGTGLAGRALPPQKSGHSTPTALFAAASKSASEGSASRSSASTSTSSSSSPSRNSRREKQSLSQRERDMWGSVTDALESEEDVFDHNRGMHSEQQQSAVAAALLRPLPASDSRDGVTLAKPFDSVPTGSVSNTVSDELSDGRDHMKVEFVTRRPAGSTTTGGELAASFNNRYGQRFRGSKGPASARRQEPSATAAGGADAARISSDGDNGIGHNMGLTLGDLAGLSSIGNSSATGAASSPFSSVSGSSQGPRLDRGVSSGSNAPAGGHGASSEGTGAGVSSSAATPLGGVLGKSRPNNNPFARGGSGRSRASATSTSSAGAAVGLTGIEPVAGSSGGGSRSASSAVHVGLASSVVGAPPDVTAPISGRRATSISRLQKRGNESGRSNSRPRDDGTGVGSDEYGTGNTSNSGGVTYQPSTASTSNDRFTVPGHPYASYAGLKSGGGSANPSPTGSGGGLWNSAPMRITGVSATSLNVNTGSHRAVSPMTVPSLNSANDAFTSGGISSTGSGASYVPSLLGAAMGVAIGGRAIHPGIAAASGGGLSRSSSTGSNGGATLSPSSAVPVRLQAGSPTRAASSTTPTSTASTGGVGVAIGAARPPVGSRRSRDVETAAAAIQFGSLSLQADAVGKPASTPSPTSADGVSYPPSSSSSSSGGPPIAGRRRGNSDGVSGIMTWGSPESNAVSSISPPASGLAALAPAVDVSGTGGAIAGRRARAGTGGSTGTAAGINVNGVVTATAAASDHGGNVILGRAPSPLSGLGGGGFHSRYSR